MMYIGKAMDRNAIKNADGCLKLLACWWCVFPADITIWLMAIVLEWAMWTSLTTVIFRVKVSVSMDAPCHHTCKTSHHMYDIGLGTFHFSKMANSIFENDQFYLRWCYQWKWDFLAFILENQQLYEKELLSIWKKCTFFVIFCKQKNCLMQGKMFYIQCVYRQVCIPYGLRLTELG